MKVAALPWYCLLCCARWLKNFEFVDNILKCDHLWEYSFTRRSTHKGGGGTLPFTWGVAPFLGVLPYLTYLNNRALLSKALSRDRLPKEIDVHNKYSPVNVVRRLIRSLNIKFPRNLSHIGPEKEGLYYFYGTTLNFERKLPKTATVR